MDGRTRFQEASTVGKRDKLIPFAIQREHEREPYFVALRLFLVAPFSNILFLGVCYHSTAPYRLKSLIVVFTASRVFHSPSLVLYSPPAHVQSLRW